MMGNSIKGLRIQPFMRRAARAPEMYSAYIGIAQISKPLESEKLAYKYMMEQYTIAGDKRMVQKLEKFPISKMGFVPDSYRSLRDEAMHELGIGTVHTMKSVISGIFLPSWKCPEYTLREKINIWRGKPIQNKVMEDSWNEIYQSSYAMFCSFNDFHGIKRMHSCNCISKEHI